MLLGSTEIQESLTYR